MTEREKANYRELLKRATFIVGQCHLLLSDCEDGDREKIPGADDTTVRHSISHAVHDLCQWTGCASGKTHGKGAPQPWAWNRFTNEKHPPVVLPVREVQPDPSIGRLEPWKEAFWDGHWIDLNHMAMSGWTESGPGIAIPE